MLVDAVATVRDEQPVDETLQQLKEKGQRRWERDDVMWFELVLSHATLGGSWGAHIVVNDAGEIDEQRYGSVAFRTLDQIEKDQRERYLEARLTGNVRLVPTKADRIERNFERIKEQYDDPLGAKEAFTEADGVEAKMKFLQQFTGIGEKYARNIPMDLYLEDSRQFIAVDSRVKGLLKETGYPVDERSYEDIEAHLQSVAANLAMEPWELDRTLYNFTDEVSATL